MHCDFFAGGELRPRCFFLKKMNTNPPPSIDLIAFKKAIDEAESYDELLVVEIKINRAIGWLHDYAHTFTGKYSNNCTSEYFNRLRTLLDKIDTKKKAANAALTTAQPATPQ